MDVSQLLSQKRLTNRFTQPILLDADAAVRCSRAHKAVEEAAAQLEQAQKAEAGKMAQPTVARAEQALAAAEAERDEADAAAEEHLADFVFESIGSTAYDDLLDAHPSPDDQKERLGDADPGYDTKTWPLAIVAASLCKIVLADGETVEVTAVKDAQALKDQAPDVVWDQVLSAAIRVNRGANAVPKSLTGSGRTRPSEPKSEQQ